MFLRKNHKKRLKICFFSPGSYPFFFPDSKIAHGGAELQMYLWAKSLSKNPDFEIIFLVGANLSKKELQQTNIHLKKTIRLKQNENLGIKVLKAIIYFLQLLKLNPDIVICTNASALVGISAFYTKLFKKKFIYRSSSSIDVNKSWIKKNKLMGKIYAWGLKNTDKILIQNTEYLQLLSRNHNLSAQVLRNVFPVQNIKITNKKFVLWVSRYVKMKNPDLFLELAKNIPDKQFIMICPYDSSNYKIWKMLKENTKQIPNLNLIEKVPFFKIQKYFNEALLFVNTSDFEGFPNTFLQAAQGKTAIVSLNVNPDNFINEYDCGIFCNNNFDELIEKTKKLLQNKAKLKQKGENAYNYLKENHDINIIGKKLEQIIYITSQKLL